MAKKIEVGASEVRTWATEQGLTTGSRGRFSAELIEAFHAAHPRRVYSPNLPVSVTVKGTRVSESGYKTPVSRKTTLGEVRAFALAEGLSVGKRGRVSQEVLSAFAASPKV